MIRHHPTDELLVEYAAGASCEAVSLVIAVHCAMCPTCRDLVADLEVLGGAMLDRQQPSVAETEHLLDGLLAALDGLEPEPPVATEPPGDLTFPEPLRSMLSHADPGQLPWKTVLPGYEQIELPMRVGPVPVRLSRFAPGFVTPKHTHGGFEHVLVFTGGYLDHDGPHARGDMSCADETLSHSVQVDPGEPCIVLIVAEDWLHPQSPHMAAARKLVDF